MRRKLQVEGVQIKKITDNITQLTYPDYASMNNAFCRITEHAEGPAFRGKIFTLGDLRKWYSTEYGSWSYYRDWAGHNMPSTSLDAFVDGSFDPLTKEEQEIVDLFRYKPKPYYVIALYEGARDDVFVHEMAHALFGTNAKYKAEVENAVKAEWAKLKAVRAKLKELGYNEAVFMDETHAYVGVDSKYLDEKKVDYPKELSVKLKKIFNKYYKT